MKTERDAIDGQQRDKHWNRCVQETTMVWDWAEDADADEKTDASCAGS